MNIQLLLDAVDGPVVSAWDGSPVPVTAVTSDSREVGPGVVFVATHHRGYARDGHDYVDDAVRRGAAAVVVDRQLPTLRGTPVVMVASTAQEGLMRLKETAFQLK